MIYVELSNSTRTRDIIDRLTFCKTIYGYVDYPCERWIVDISHVHLGYMIVFKADRDNTMTDEPMHMLYGYQETFSDLIAKLS